MMRMACFIRAKVQLYVETTKDFLCKCSVNAVLCA